MADPCFRLRLFGDFQLFADDDPLVLGQPRLEELLAFLAIQPDIHFPRAQIAYLFWPDSSEKQALANTRGLIHKLKKAWPAAEEAVVMERSHLTWRRDSSIAVDLHHYIACEHQAQTAADAAQRRDAMERAAGLYGGDLVPSCYSDWILTAREDLRARYAALLDALIDDALDRREPAKALQWAEALRAHDPLRESTCRWLMEIHALMDDRAAALRVYHKCATLLQNELGIEPSQPLQELHHQLLKHTAAPGEESTTPKPAERSKLIGRHREWRTLQQHWQAAGRGEAHCVIIWGEAGIGKTRLAEELIDWVRRLGHGWASSRSYAARGALTYAPITEWLRSPALATAAAGLDDLWRVEAARLLPELLADRPDLPPPGPLTESWQQQRFYQAIVRIMQQVSGPLVLHLDDMQWCDRETLMLLHFILHGARSRPLLLLGTVRTEDAAENAPLASLLNDLRHGEELTELTLGPLARDETTALAAQTAGRTLDPELVEQLFSTSEGHPLFLIEAVRSGLGTEVQSAGDQGHGRAVPTPPAGIPPKIFELLSRRLGQLSAQAQEIASAAAVIGRAFTYPVLRSVLALDELALIDGLDELWTRRIIREQVNDAYDFTHDRIRETAYQLISRARRRLLHLQVAQALEAIHGHDLEPVAAELAAHYAQAGESPAAFRYFRMAAAVARRTFALSSAKEMLLLALDHAADNPAMQIDTCIKLNQIYLDTFEFAAWQKSLAHIEARLDQLPATDARLQVDYMLDRARYSEVSGARMQGLDIARRAVEIAEGVGNEELLAHAYCELGVHYWSQARMVDARSAFERCIDHAAGSANHPVLAKVLEMLAATGMFTGMLPGRISALLSESLQLAQADGDKRQIASLHNKFGYLPIAQGTGDFNAAEAAYQHALALAREIGFRNLEENVLANLVVLNSVRGDYHRALASYQQATAIGDDKTNRLFYWVKRHYCAATLMQMGALEPARRQLEAACAHLGRQQNHHFEVKARSDLGLLYHLAGDQQAAYDELRTLLELIDGHGDLRFEALVNTRLGYVYEAMARPDRALQAYAKGDDLHAAMEQHVYALNARAGTARILAAQGDTAAAHTMAGAIWETLAGRETDATVETARTLYTCYSLFHGQSDPRADAVLRQAYEQVQLRAASIDDPAHKAAFWEMDDHRFIALVQEDARLPAV